MKFLSVRNGASGPQKKGWALPVKLKPQADKIASSQAVIKWPQF